MKTGEKETSFMKDFLVSKTEMLMVWRVSGLALASAEVKKLKPAKAGNERVLEPASLNEMSEFYCKYC